MNHLDIMVPYPESNSSVRARALEWVSRIGGDSDEGGPRIAVHGPGFARKPLSQDRVLVLRNARRLTRGKREERLLSDAQLGVYDLDDGLPWDDGCLPDLGRWWKRPWPRSLVARRAAEAADRVIAGNQTIANWADQHCNDVRIIPTCVEPSDYRQRADWSIAGDVPVIGWIGSPSTQHYLLDVASSLREVNRRTGARVEAVGADAEVLASLGPFVSAIPWTIEAGRERLASWDVGIMPLRDGIYERAKCGYKLLQYAAARVPAIGSPVGVNAEILTSMRAKSPSSAGDWADALIDVIDAGDDVRAGMASAGAHVAEEYSYSRWLGTWTAAVGEDNP